MHEAIYQRLLDAAADGDVLSYTHIAPLANLDMSRADHRQKMAEILDEISTHEHEQGRPLLSALVVHASGEEKSTPGKGFFTLAQRLGLHKSKDNVTFFARELTRLFDYWRGHRRRK